MTTPAIRAEGIGKCYRLLGRDSLPDTFLSAALSWFRSPLSNWRVLRSLSTFKEGDDGDDVLWALRDISFEVQPGEVVAFIGANGHGKSTLLKVLSRITQPTTGRAEINGRVASLLEVGTGFHPDLSGRENIYLNGTVLGMSRNEVNAKFDDIVSFSGLERFIDTPVKRYSSGMSVRLAFSVAAHLEPEILLIDEVLSVGDAQFRKKSVGKMEEVASQGRTVLFVSHDLAAVSALCSRCIWLRHGQIAASGPVDEVIKKYLNSSQEDARLGQSASGNVVESVRFFDDNNSPIHAVQVGKPLRVAVTLRPGTEIKQPHVSLFIHSNDGTRIFSAPSLFQSGDFFRALEGGSNSIVCRIPRMLLMPGTYYVNLIVFDHFNRLDEIEQVAWFDVDDGDFYGTGRQALNSHGLVCADGDWTIEHEVAKSNVA